MIREAEAPRRQILGLAAQETSLLEHIRPDFVDDLLDDGFGALGPGGG